MSGEEGLKRKQGGVGVTTLRMKMLLRCTYLLPKEACKFMMISSSSADMFPLFKSAAK
jgi:hypothetical protein